MKRAFHIVFFTLIFIEAFAQKQCDTIVNKVDTATFKAMLAKHDGTLIDVRTSDEFISGHIKGAVNIDFRASDFEKKIAKLEKHKTYYVYCAIGGRSTQATEYMKTQGFCKIIMLDRGLRAWTEAGYPITKE